MHILEAERCVVAGGTSILPGLNKKKNCNCDHICYSLCVIVPGHAIGLCKDKNDYADGDWIDSFGEDILSLLRSDLMLAREVNVSMEVFPEI
jgi:hypothetical protein